MWKFYSVGVSNSGKNKLLMWYQWVSFDVNNVNCLFEYISKESKCHFKNLFLREKFNYLNELFNNY